MRFIAPSQDVWIGFFFIMGVLTLYLLIVGSLAFAAQQRIKRGPLRVAALVVLLVCGMCAPPLILVELGITDIVHRLTLAIFSIVAMFKLLELILGTTLHGVLDSKGNWLVSGLHVVKLVSL
jgi:hypothetical protein